ncbi:hypothetical protein BIFBRE_03971 [Bifidobacterium breve DSM 20213 = JCM 1192]|uniref:Uncharacterized protein n=1 Tax=Bifidobacterium breve DSM 20213 = JCM 1192 TaxID=518634 RepID=D4BPG2_BIFBR|nr:hypothetical protein BIFBRE_03971 [Bifidobacterium breve DSM 20213 = JCM 1192]
MKKVDDSMNVHVCYRHDSANGLKSMVFVRKHRKGVCHGIRR